MRKLVAADGMRDYTAQVNEVTASAVTEAFGLGALAALPSMAARGAMGEVWKVETERGAWAVKALFPWAEYEPLPRDVQVQFAALAAGIALPRPVVHGSVAMVRVESRCYRAYEWVDLAPFSPPPATTEVANAAGRILGLVHTLPFAVDEDADGWYTTAPEPAEMRVLADAADDTGASWGPALRAAEPLMADLHKFIATDHAPPALCHRDFDMSNVLPAAETNELITLDWENVGPLAPDEELGSALLTWCTASGAVEERAVTAFLDGYTAAGGAAVPRADRSFSMAVCTSLNFLRVMAEQALQRDEHLEFATARVNELLHSSLQNLVVGIRNLTRIVA